MQIHTEFREIPGKFYCKNIAEFRGISRNSVCFFKKFRIPPEVKKSTSVDTLHWTCAKDPTYMIRHARTELNSVKFRRFFFISGKFTCLQSETAGKYFVIGDSGPSESILDRAISIAVKNDRLKRAEHSGSWITFLQHIPLSSFTHFKGTVSWDRFQKFWQKVT
jgi:hypothetical protein